MSTEFIYTIVLEGPAKEICSLDHFLHRTEWDAVYKKYYKNFGKYSYGWYCRPGKIISVNKDISLYCARDFSTGRFTFEPLIVLEQFKNIKEFWV